MHHCSELGGGIEGEDLEPDQKKPSRRVRFKAVKNASNIWFERVRLAIANGITITPVLIKNI